MNIDLDDGTSLLLAGIFAAISMWLAVAGISFWFSVLISFVSLMLLASFFTR